MFYTVGWTTEAYRKACEDCKIYSVAKEFMLVPEILLRPGMSLRYSSYKEVAWIEHNSERDDEIISLTQAQFDQLAQEGVFYLLHP